MALYELAGNRPRVHPTCFIHPLASVIGKVQIGAHCYVGPGASIRGDWVEIRISEGSNVQDSCTIHGSPGVVVALGAGAHLGHGCVVHGATLEENVLVGMHAVVQDDAVLGAGCVIGSGCVIPAGMVVPAGKLCVGVPGKVVGDVRPETRTFKSLGTRWYQQLNDRGIADLVACELEDCLFEAEYFGEWRAWEAELEGYPESG